MDQVANKTDVPGKFRYTSRRECTCTERKTNDLTSQYFYFHILFNIFLFSGWGHLTELSIVDVKYDEYALTYAVKTKENDTFIINKLYGKVIFGHDSPSCRIHLNLLSCSVK